MITREDVLLTDEETRMVFLKFKKSIEDKFGGENALATNHESRKAFVDEVNAGASSFERLEAQRKLWGAIREYGERKDGDIETWKIFQLSREDFDAIDAILSEGE
jgi:hypothetical protein